ncbi:mobile element protein [alpha proteobacterium U9-1i]|nr:mobile element protein [alpha proteobacterium U9-1i]
MPKSWKRHSADEIVAKLERAGELMERGASVSEASANVGITDATYFRWRKQYAGLRSSQLKYIKELEVEVARLRKAIHEYEGVAA